MDELERIKQLAGVDKLPVDQSMGENLSYVGTQKSQYQRKHNIKPGTDEWFKLWYTQPSPTSENTLHKNK